MTVRVRFKFVYPPKKVEKLQTDKGYEKELTLEKRIK